jgi:hypothetical protein
VCVCVCEVDAVDLSEKISQNQKWPL